LRRVPREKFDPAKLDPAVAKGLEKSLSVAMEKLQAASNETGAPVNGWRVTPMVLGNFGSNYGPRAVVALVAWAPTCRRTRCTHPPLKTC